MVGGIDSVDGLERECTFSGVASMEISSSGGLKVTFWDSLDGFTFGLRCQGKDCFKLLLEILCLFLPRFGFRHD